MLHPDDVVFHVNELFLFFEHGGKEKIGEPRCFKGNHFHLHNKKFQRRRDEWGFDVYSEKGQFIGRIHLGEESVTDLWPC